MMNRKSNKIKVVISSDLEERRRCLAKLAAAEGFALTPSDAKKIISSDIVPEDTAERYFILCDTYSFHGSDYLNQRLYEMAARGMFVAVGVRSLPRQYHFLAETYLPMDLI